MAQCIRCFKNLSADEIAIYRRLIHRGAQTFLCRECLADKLGCGVEKIDEKIAHFKEIGCTLFLKN